MAGYTGLKYLNKLIENTWRTNIFESNIFVISHTYDKNIYMVRILHVDLYTLSNVHVHDAYN